jgi:integrase
MKSSSSKRKRIDVKEGNIVIPIYEFSDGRYCLDTMLGTRRTRITRASLDAAKMEAHRLIAQISSGRHDEPLLSIAEVEDYRLAKQKLNGHGVSLLAAIEEWVESKSRKTNFTPKTIPQIVEELLAKKKAEGISKRHFEDRRDRWNRFARDFTGRIDQVTAKEIETWLNRLKVASRTKNNYRDAIQQLFRFALSQQYLSRGEPLVTENVAEVRVKEGAIHIYTPQELQTLLTHAPSKLVPFFALGAFAGLRTQEIVRLEWQDIRFKQSVIEVSAAKAKTASRRLVPILPALREWLEPLQKSCGPVLEFCSYTAFDYARSRFCELGIQENGKTVEFQWKSNALRHSYASYRLAKIKNAAEVALEMGNSPSMLFRNYRELVTEQAADEWFSILPAKS